MTYVTIRDADFENRLDRLLTGYRGNPWVTEAVVMNKHDFFVKYICLWWSCNIMLDSYELYLCVTSFQPSLAVWYVQTCDDEHGSSSHSHFVFQLLVILQALGALHAHWGHKDGDATQQDPR